MSHSLLINEVGKSLLPGRTAVSVEGCRWLCSISCCLASWEVLGGKALLLQVQPGGGSSEETQGAASRKSAHGGRVTAATADGLPSWWCPQCQLCPEHWLIDALLSLVQGFQSAPQVLAATLAQEGPALSSVIDQLNATCSFKTCSKPCWWVPSLLCVFLHLEERGRAAPLYPCLKAHTELSYRSWDSPGNLGRAWDGQLEPPCAAAITRIEGGLSCRACSDDPLATPESVSRAAPSPPLGTQM